LPGIAFRDIFSSHHLLNIRTKAAQNRFGNPSAITPRVTALPFFAANVAAPQLAAPAAAVSTHPFPAASQQDIAAAGTPVSGFENLVQLFLQGEEADSALLEPNPAPADGSAASPTVNTNIVPVVMSVITQPPVITDLRTPEQQLEEHEERPEEECQVPTGMLLSVSPANPTAAPSPNKEVEVQDAQDQSVAESDRKPAPPPQCRPAVVEFPALAVEQPTMEDAAPDVITEQQDIEQPGVEPPETQEHPARDQIRVATGNQPGGASKAIQPAIRDKVVIEGTHNGEAPANEAFALEVHTSPEVGAQEPNRDRQTTKAKAQPMENAPRPTTPRVSTEPTRQNDTGTSQKEHRHPTESHQSAPKEQETTAQPASTAPLQGPSRQAATTPLTQTPPPLRAPDRGTRNLALSNLLRRRPPRRQRNRRRHHRQRTTPYSKSRPSDSRVFNWASALSSPCRILSFECQRQADRWMFG
jgi:hypothetical protein